MQDSTHTIVIKTRIVCSVAKAPLVTRRGSSPSSSHFVSSSFLFLLKNERGGFEGGGEPGGVGVERGLHGKTSGRGA
jgi:hypothetical protein